MSMNIRFPNITGTNPAEQIAQIKSYLYQLVEQLNWMLPAIESGTESAGASNQSPSYGDISAETFYELKSLLIQSSDTLNAYYEQINAKLEGQYVKQTAFDAHKQEAAQSFVAQTSYDAYKQEVSQQFDGLGDQYVAQADFDTFKQENTGVIANLDSKYVSQATYDAHTQEASQDIADLQQSVSDLQQIVGELQQAINSMQETGG